MAAPKCDWIGKSGTKFTYYVYELPASLKDELGNYIFCKLNDQNRWIPIYIGEGNLKDRVTSGDHHQADCIERKGATHVHAHLTDTKQNSQSAEEDLLGYYTNAYRPHGCNEKTGG